MTTRNRQMTPADRRRVTIDAIGINDPRLVIIEAEPLRDEDTGELLPVVVEDHHRGLQHLDGDSEIRPPADWEKQNSHDRYWTHAGVRADLTEELHRDRANLRLHESLALVTAELGTFQTPKAQARRETDAKSGTDRDNTPTVDEGVAYAHADEIHRRLTIIRLEVEALWDLHDIHKGYLHKSYAMMEGWEKDELLTGPKFRDLTPEEINALHPELGAPVTIRRKRAEAGQDARGNPAPPRRPWSREEDRLVLAQTGDDRALGERLERSENAIRVRRNRLREQREDQPSEVVAP